MAKITVRLPDELCEKARNLVYWTPGLTLNELAAGAIAAYLEQLEAEGGAIAPRKGELKPGRVVKGASGDG